MSALRAMLLVGSLTLAALATPWPWGALWLVVPLAVSASLLLAWRYGLKTTYYLRSQSATHVEKSTLQGTDGRLNAVPVTPPPAPVVPMDDSLLDAPNACLITDPDCEACQ